MTPQAFHGAKLILFIGEKLLVARRDDIPSIPFPNQLDFPGGGREDDEDPATCALRETREEVGLTIPREDLIWSTRYGRHPDIAWCFAAHVPSQRADDIVFGNEGQSWLLISPHSYLDHPASIPHLADRLRDYLLSPQYLCWTERPPAR